MRVRCTFECEVPDEDLSGTEGDLINNVLDEVLIDLSMCTFPKDKGILEKYNFKVEKLNHQENQVLKTGT